MSTSFLKTIKSLFNVKRSLVPVRNRLRKAEKIQDLSKIKESIDEKTDLEETVEAFEEKYSDEKREQSLKDFDLLQVLGRGTYGKVILVQCKLSRKLYALKALKKSTIVKNSSMDSLQTEKRVYEKVWMHPYLVNLHACFQNTSRIFFVMDFVRGGDLITLLTRHQQLPEQQTQFYAAEIALALNFLHKNGIIFRDLKLDNVLLDHEGHIKLADYGICKDGMRKGDRTTSFCGTPAYLAPETIMGKEYNYSVDWWALGVIVFEMLAGYSPFSNTDASENSESKMYDLLFDEIVYDVVSMPRSFSIRATSFIKELLSKEPTERLGCRVDNAEEAFTDVTGHIFFKNIDWELLRKRELSPPYVPELSSDTDVSCFPKELTEENIQFTPDEESDIEINQKEFEGFECQSSALL